MLTNSQKNRICRDILNAYGKIFRSIVDYDLSRRSNNLESNFEYDEILNNYYKEIEIVKEYKKSSEDAYACCKEWFKKNETFLNVKAYNINDNSVNFYSTKLYDFFNDKGDDITKDPWRFRYEFGSGNNGIHSWIRLHKNENEAWSDSQNKIIDILKSIGYSVEDNEDAQKDRSIRICQILSDDYLGKPVDSKTKSEIIVNLEKFKKKIEVFENNLQ